MTIQDAPRGPQGPQGLTNAGRYVELTETEIMDAVAAAACEKLGLVGEHRVEMRFVYEANYGVKGAYCDVIPVAAGTTQLSPRFVFRQQLATENPRSDT